MGVSRWKRWLSYLMEIHVESAPSAVNPHLYVSLNKGRYQLSTANAIYSFEDLYDNFEKSFRRIDLNRYAIDQVLLLGFGLGSIPYMLERVFGRNYQYTGVELDESVIYLAGKYCLPHLHSAVSLICTDAAVFVAQTEERFELICIDLFLDDHIPEHISAPEFLEHVQNLLTPGGIILFNHLGRTEADKIAADRYFREVFVQAFPKGEKWQVGGNIMMVSL